MTQSSNIGRARVAVVTGASAGIGKAAAKALVAMGWRVIGVGRNPARSAQALDEIRAHAPAAQVAMIVADLALMADTRRVAREVAQLTDKVDVLLNNAGGIGKEMVVTAEGNEACFAGNHLGPFLLTDLLLPLLRAARTGSAPGDVRIVNVSSSASDLSRGFDWDDLQMMREHQASPAYCNAKLANILFTRGLAKRLEGTGIVANAMHPGVVSTNFASYGDDELQQIVAGMQDISVSAEQGADTLVWLATSLEGGAASGGYFYNRAPADMNPIALDDSTVERLWSETKAIVAKVPA